jgi:hypothetical protein
VGGKTFSSIRDAAAAHGRQFAKVYDRLSKGWTLEQALGLTTVPDTTKYRGKNLVIDSVIYPSIAKAAAAYNVDSEALRKRLVKGEDAVSAIAAISRRSRRS